MLGLPAGLFVSRQLWRFVSAEASPGRLRVTDGALLTSLGIEVVLAALLLPWLVRRGWHPRAQLGAPSSADIWRGAALWVVTFGIVKLVRLALSVMVPDVVAASQASAVHGTLSWWVYIAALVINPVFEEVLWLGYAIPTLAQSIGVRGAAIVSVVLRVGVHLNQGLPALTGVLPVGMVWTGYYLWRRRVWPVVVAHVINSAFGLGDFVGGGDG